jgi:hypothetical protein
MLACMFFLWKGHGGPGRPQPKQSNVEGVLALVIDRFSKTSIVHVNGSRDRGASGKGKWPRSIQENHVIKDVQHKVFLWHSAYLQVIDLCHRGRRRSKDDAARTGTRTPDSDFIINIRQILRRIKSLCRKLYPHR